MKLVTIIMNKRIEFYTEASMNKQKIESLWHFYSVYNISLAITGFEDKNIKKKNRLMSRLIESQANGKFDFPTYNKLVNFSKNDMKVIEMAIEQMEIKQEAGEIFGDNHRKGMFAINRYD